MPTAARILPQASNWVYLAICLLAPVAAGFVRKLVPGQPSFVRVAGVGAVAIVFLIFVSRPKPPNWVRIPVNIWFVFCAIYLVPAFLYSATMGLAVLMIYLLPLGLIGIAYSSIRCEDSIVGLAKVFGWLGALLLPLAILVSIAGNEILPIWLQASGESIELGLDQSKGLFPAPSLLLSTPTELAYTMLPAVYLILSAIESKRLKGEDARLLWVLAIACGMLLYLCGRRMVTLVALLGFCLVLLRGRTGSSKKLFFGAVFTVGLVFLVDQWAIVDQRLISHRSDVLYELDIQTRITEIFLGITLRWIELCPFGHFLGYSGPLSAAFHVDLEYPFVEVGAATLVADMGILGLVLFILVVVWLMVNIWNRVGALVLRPVVLPLLTFMVVSTVLFLTKNLRVLTNATPTHFLFWAVPGMVAAICRRELLSLKKKTSETCEQPPEQDDKQ